jgi:YaiO family outer membrane protein
MRRGLVRRSRLVAAWAAIGVLGAALPLGAQGFPRGRVDVVAQGQHVSHALGDWRSLALRVLAQPSVRDTWFLEALWQQAFTDAGMYASVGERHAFGSRWTTYLSAGSGTGKFVLPDVRADAQVAFTWGPGRRLITTVGGTAIDAKRGYSDVAGMASLTMYLGPAAVLEAGGRATRSSPGDVRSTRAFGALTLGREGTAYVVIRGSAGGEGYQLVGLTTAIRRFRSDECAISWRQWVGGSGGLFAQGEYYANDVYTRSGVSVGVFASW